MGFHVHDDDPISWTAARMARHLREAHDLTTPMVWDAGRLHQLHLDAHQQKASGLDAEALHQAVRDNLAQLETECQATYGLGNGQSGICRRPIGHPPISEDRIGHSRDPIPVQPKAEEALMPQHHHEHDDIARVHDTLTRQELEQHLSMSHGLQFRDINALGIYSQHASLHPMKTPEKAPEEQLEERARQLYENDAGGPQPDWDELGQETRDHYRERVKTESESYEKTSEVLEERARQLYENMSTANLQPHWDDLSRETKDHYRSRVKEVAPEAYEDNPVNQSDLNPAIVRDRLIAALAGVDFDRDWAADNRLGPHGRGALRYAYQASAERLRSWLERGGASYLPGFSDLVEDLSRERQLVENLESINNSLRNQLAITGRQCTTAAVDLEHTRQLLRNCQNTRDRYQRDLDLAHQEMDELRAELQGENAMAPVEVSQNRVRTVRPVAVDTLVSADELPQLNGDFKGLTIMVPVGTDRLMLSFVRTGETTETEKPLAAEPS